MGLAGGVGCSDERQMMRPSLVDESTTDDVHQVDTSKVVDPCGLTWNQARIGDHALTEVEDLLS
jgi:hypothetical protein